MAATRIIFALLIVLASLPAFSQENIFPRMIGKWRDINTAFTIIIEKDGSIFSENGNITGAFERSAEGGGNFSFEGRNIRCSYSIVFLGPPLQGASSWGLRYASSPDVCFRSGVFVKVDDSTKSSNSHSGVSRDGFNSNDESKPPVKFVVKNDCKNFYMATYSFVWKDKNTSPGEDEDWRSISYEMYYTSVLNLEDVDGKYIDFNKVDIYMQINIRPGFFKEYAVDVAPFNAYWPDQKIRSDENFYKEFILDGKSSLYERVLNPYIAPTCPL